MNGSDNACYRPSPDNMALSAGPTDVELGTLRQEKVRPSHIAGFTCPKCPFPDRPRPACICGSEAETKRLETLGVLYPHGWDEGSRTPLCGCSMPEHFTKRCKSCNSKMKRWTRTRRLEERISNVVEHLGDECFVAFVTLTIPNVKDDGARSSLPDEVRTLKRRVSGFRRTKGLEDRVIGGIDAFENTIRPNGDWNIHHHGIWIMSDYWNQKELQKEWGYRVRIEKVRRPHAVLKYLTTYATKEPIEGVRCLETFGASRGAAYTAIAESVRLRRDSNTAEHALEE